MRTTAAVALIAFLGQVHASPSTAVRQPLVYSQLRQPQQAAHAFGSLPSRSVVDRTSVVPRAFDFFKKKEAPAPAPAPSGKVGGYKNTAYIIAGKTELPIPDPEQAEEDENNVVLRYGFSAKRASVITDVNQSPHGERADVAPDTYKNTAYIIQGKTELPKGKPKQAAEDEDNWLLKFAFSSKRASVISDVKAAMNPDGSDNLSVGLAQISTDFMSLSAAGLLGAFVGGGVTFAMCRSRGNDMTAGHGYSLL